MKHRSSTIVAVCGSNSEISMPHCPYFRNSKGDASSMFSLFGLMDLDAIRDAAGRPVWSTRFWDRRDPSGRARHSAQAESRLSPRPENDPRAVSNRCKPARRRQAATPHLRRRCRTANLPGRFSRSPGTTVPAFSCAKVVRPDPSTVGPISSRFLSLCYLSDSIYPGGRGCQSFVDSDVDNSGTRCDKIFSR